jgi:hypothetical protein
VLALGVEADQLGRAGEEAEDARHLQELLEVEDGIVAAGPERPHQASDGAREAGEGRDLDGEHARHEPALLEERLVPGEGEEVDLDLGDGGAQRRQRGQDHDEVAEPVELDGEDAPRPGPGAARRRRCGGAGRRQAAAGGPADGVQAQVDGDARPAVDVARGEQVHGAAGGDATSRAARASKLSRTRGADRAASRV